MKSYVVCGILGRYLIAFVKIIASSKFHSCRRLLAFKTLEVIIIRALLPSTMEVIDLEDLIMCSYYGHRNLKPFLAYTLFKDINNGDFVIMKPHDPILAHMWMGTT
jgi:hypothetical protein